MGEGESESIAFELAYGQLRSQKEDLQFFRGQASFAAAVAGLISTVFATILGDQIVSSTGMTFLGLSPVSWIIFTCFSLSVGFSVKAFMGWRSCTFDLSPAMALYYSEHNLSSIDLKKMLASDADRYFDENEDVITDTRHFLALALTFAWLQIPAWLLLLM
ncbi:hypothetical protein ACNQ62_07140 [Sulfitobacter sp. SBS6]|uniref:hypothetical protein n=1 Tax=Sulfitobacter sp. SBS6 TaxID=3401755 RepID=UPI003AAD08ED